MGPGPSVGQRPAFSPGPGNSLIQIAAWQPSPTDDIGVLKATLLIEPAAQCEFEARASGAEAMVAHLKRKHSGKTAEFTEWRTPCQLGDLSVANRRPRTGSATEAARPENGQVYALLQFDIIGGRASPPIASAARKWALHGRLTRPPAPPRQARPN